MSDRYTLIKLPLKELIRHDFDINLSRDEEIEKGFFITQETSLLFDQIERLRGSRSSHINEVILVTAKKNPNQEKDLRHVLTNGFFYNGVHYSRFGKSGSQAKEGITAFVCDSIFEKLYKITQMDLPMEECVISKYEAQRCLVFSSCTLIEDYMPNIVIVGEYQKELKNQLIKYVVEKEETFKDKESGKEVRYQSRKVEEGCRNIPLSPFDGCGCHEYAFTQKISRQLHLDYDAVGMQIRLPFMKGFSVYVPFRKILKEWGCESITDIYGNEHPIDDVDCIWNITMFKGHGLFFERYKNRAWSAYTDTLSKYHFKLGISKYSHHTKNLNKYTRMNFQYLQCLDLWNPDYIHCYETKSFEHYDILAEEHRGKIISLAGYTTGLFEKIIKGDPFYTYKFMGITNSKDHEPESRYLEAALINKAMLKDPAIKQFLYRKLKKYIDEAKVGKIYCSGFYHTGIGDMIGYLQYAAGLLPVGCLRENELYTANLDCGTILSFRSPLVDPSEVNKIKIVQNEVIDKWFGHFKDQDIVMFNMYDISAPGQGGADFDGDIFFLCDDPVLISSKIDKPVVLDIADKATALSVPYTKENIVEYEIMTRDSRIGEITNAATSIENRYTGNKEIRKRYDDYTSLLRIFQGKEIDFLKTGFRWHMNAGLKKHLKQLPYFLLYNYPEKQKTYKTLLEKNRHIEPKEDKVPLNVYRSPSPMNELCDYICVWERKNILWDNSLDHLKNTYKLISRHDLDFTDKNVTRTVRRYINRYADEIRKYKNLQKENGYSESLKYDMELTVHRFKSQLQTALSLDEETIANYVIHVSYTSPSISKAFAWAGYGDYIIKNLKENSRQEKSVSIREVFKKTSGSYEYLGKYYELKEADDHGTVFI